jgi:threonine/homoserine/homoserine lactone efflux protein
MSLDLFLGFVAATILLVITPGPTVTLVVSYALAQGRRSGFATVAGVALGDLTAMTLSVLGLGALLAASATLFTIVKWAGAAYLVYLGVRLWRADPDGETAAIERRSPRAMLAHAFAVTALNPKSIVFFVAFLPQFVDASAPVVPQLVLLVATFVTIATLNAGVYALLAGNLGAAIREKWLRRMVNRISGTVLIGAGIAAIAWKRATP